VLTEDDLTAPYECMIALAMPCRHPQPRALAFMTLVPECEICKDELRRHKEALQKIVNRVWELGDYLPREVLEDIMRIVNNALKGSIGPK
jgi:hypothetical protein